MEGVKSRQQGSVCIGSDITNVVSWKDELWKWHDSVHGSWKDEFVPTHTLGMACLIHVQISQKGILYFSVWQSSKMRQHTFQALCIGPMEESSFISWPQGMALNIVCGEAFKVFVFVFMSS